MTFQNRRNRKRGTPLIGYAIRVTRKISVHATAPSEKKAMHITHNWSRLVSRRVATTLRPHCKSSINQV